MRLEEWQSLPLKRSWCHTDEKGRNLRTEIRIDTTTGLDLMCTFPVWFLEYQAEQKVVTIRQYIIATLAFLLMVVIVLYLSTRGTTP